MDAIIQILIAIRDTFNHHVVFSVGFLLVAGYFLGKGAEKIKLPAISGYIVAGLILGDSVTGIIHAEMSSTLRAITDVALGIIAVTIGSEFNRSKIKRLGKSIAVITLVQLMMTFVIVAIALRIFGMSLVESILLGAIASATAPAATVVIIQKLRARGDFVDTLYGIVALDDAGAVLLFAVVMALSGSMLGLGNGSTKVFQIILKAVEEIGLSIVIGIISGILLHLLTYKKQNNNEILIISLGVIFITTAVAISLELSPLLANMVTGAVVVNLSDRGPRIFRAVSPMTPPLYATFFAIAGTELKLSVLTGKGVLIFGAIYILARVLGKYSGVWLGSVLIKAESNIKKYLGLSMLPQAGVAIGLVLFLQANPIADTPEIQTMFTQMINIVLYAVLINELIGPPLSKYAIIKGADL